MSHFPPVLYRGSVKNVRGETTSPSLLFEFSDRYSVFDWGEMPDQLEGKGAALASMGKAFFAHLEKASSWVDLFSSPILRETFSSDYLKALENSDVFKRYKHSGMPHHALLNQEWPQEFLEVKNVQVLRPPLLPDGHYDYTAYQNRPTNALVPLEIIFRMGLSPGNSLTKRMGGDPKKWQEMGFSTPPKEGELLQVPFIDFSTKLERGDRYLSYGEAQKISGLKEAEWSELKETAHLVALNLFHFHHQLGLELWDGKIEVAFFGQGENRSFMLVDSIGIDELRLLYKGKSFSKEFLRENYKESPWYKALELAKKEAGVTGEDFKAICLEKFKAAPEPLGPTVKARAEAVYKSYANGVCAQLGRPLPFSPEFNLHNYSEMFL